MLADDRRYRKTSRDASGDAGRSSADSLFEGDLGRVGQRVGGRLRRRPVKGGRHSLRQVGARVDPLCQGVDPRPRLVRGAPPRPSPAARPPLEGELRMKAELLLHRMRPVMTILVWSDSSLAKPPRRPLRRARQQHGPPRLLRGLVPAAPIASRRWRHENLTVTGRLAPRDVLLGVLVSNTVPVNAPRLLRGLVPAAPIASRRRVAGVFAYEPCSDGAAPPSVVPQRGHCRHSRDGRGGGRAHRPRTRERSPEGLPRASEGRRVGRSGRTRASRGDTHNLSLQAYQSIPWRARGMGGPASARDPPRRPSPARRQPPSSAPREARGVSSSRSVYPVASTWHGRTRVREGPASSPLARPPTASKLRPSRSTRWAFTRSDTHGDTRFLSLQAGDLVPAQIRSKQLYARFVRRLAPRPPRAPELRPSRSTG